MAIKQARTVTTDNEDDAPTPKPSRDPKIKTTTDSLGRKIDYKSLNVMDELKVAKAAGQYADNRSVMTFYYLAQSIVSIDGEPGIPITNERTADARVRWVGTEGYNAVYAQQLKDAREELGINEDDEDFQMPVRDTSINPDVLKN